MKIGIDANEANISTRVGVGQYAFNIIWELYRQDNQNEYHLYLKQSPQADLPLPRDNWHYHVLAPKSCGQSSLSPSFSTPTSSN